MKLAGPLRVRAESLLAGIVWIAPGPVGAGSFVVRSSDELQGNEPAPSEGAVGRTRRVARVDGVPISELFARPSTSTSPPVESIKERIRRCMEEAAMPGPPGRVELAPALTHYHSNESSSGGLLGRASPPPIVARLRRAFGGWERPPRVVCEGAWRPSIRWPAATLPYVKGSLFLRARNWARTTGRHLAL
jgi:hypothetical protein